MQGLKEIRKLPTPLNEDVQIHVLGESKQSQKEGCCSVSEVKTEHYIFLHGLGQSPESWDRVLSYLTFPANSETHCLDLWALLQCKDSTYANLYQAFAVYCANISGDVHLCGLSLGAILAMEYTLEYPEKVKSIALIGTQYKMPKMMLKIQNIIFSLMSEKSFAKMNMAKSDILILTKSMMNLDFSVHLKEISCPSLILCGEKDNANKKASRHIAEALPNAGFHIVGNAGHEVNAGNPSQLAERLEEFWFHGVQRLTQ